MSHTSTLEQYANYITVDETQQRKLFYYFVEFVTDLDSKPLVLWLNGGKGSVLFLFILSETYIHCNL